MRIINKILTVSILSLMAIVPLAGVTTTNTDTIISSENRKIFPFPTKVKHCLKNFSKYLDDRYFWKLFISERFSHFYDDNVGGFSPDIFSVPGVNGWRFLGNSHNRVYDQHSIYLPLNNFSLNSLEKKLFELSQFNKNFYVFVGPDKASIYPENMKKEFMYPGRYRYFNQVKNKLTQSGYRVIDPRDELIKEKKQSQLYYKQDTHWNPYGAYIGYKALMSSISHEQLNTTNELAIISTQSDCGDLCTNGSTRAARDSYFSTIKQEKSIDLDCGIPGKSAASASTRPVSIYSACDNSYQSFSIIQNNNALNKKSLMIIGDSFSEALSQFLVPSFSKIIFIHKTFFDHKYEKAKEIIQNNKTDFLLYESVERDFY